MKMESRSSPKPRRIFQPSELLQSFRDRNFSTFRLSPPRQTDKGTYLNLSATTDGRNFFPLHVAFKDLKFVGKVVTPLSEICVSNARGSERSSYGPVFAFQKFAADGTEQSLFVLLEKMQEYLFATMEAKIKRSEIVCQGRRTGNSVKEGGIMVKSTKIVPPIQTHIRTGPEAGTPKQNPMGRLQLTFPSPVRKREATQFFDRTAFTKTRKGGFMYKDKTVDGNPVVAANLHKVLTSGTEGSGFVDMSSVVCSNFGISIPRRVVFLILSPPPVQKPTIHDWMVLMQEQSEQDCDDSRLTIRGICRLVVMARRLCRRSLRRSLVV